MMRFITYKDRSSTGAAVLDGDRWLGLVEGDSHFPGFLETLLVEGRTALECARNALIAHGREIDLEAVALLPPLRSPPKILCVGLNYADHTQEIAIEQPPHPTIFSRFSSSLIGSGQPIVLPRVSDQLDFEGEVVAVIGRGGRDIAVADALTHVAGWSVFNDASIRDVQFRTPQWTIGKNFDDSGAFGPWFVTADELPIGIRGLTIETRLNGEVVQKASTDDMIFDVATLIADISVAMTLESGDLIVTGTPAGVGMGRIPPLWMKAGDLVEVDVEKIGVLTNHIVNQ